MKFKRFLAMLMASLTLFSLAACSPGGGGLNLFPQNSAGPDDEPSDSVSDDGTFGYRGDTLRTSFFDMTVTDAYSTSEFDTITAEEGKKLIVATIELYNYTDVTQPMYYSDFEIWWDGDETTEEDWDHEEYMKHLPVCEEVALDDGSTDILPLSDQQLPTEYELGIHDTIEGYLVYQVPAESDSYSMIFEELFEDDSTGNLFEIRFSAPEQ